MPHRNRILAFAVLGIVAPAAALAGDLRVDIKGLANGGPVYISLHDERNAESFPSDANIAALKVEPKPGGGQTAAAVFDGLAPGKYAVSAYQDENGDGELNRFIFGLPVERYGFSNAAAAYFGPPDFDSAAFMVGAGTHTETITLSGGAE